jgi:hypothetical protein
LVIRNADIVIKMLLYDYWKVEQTSGDNNIVKNQFTINEKKADKFQKSFIWNLGLWNLEDIEYPRFVWLKGLTD